MKTKKIILTSFFVVAISGLILVGCKKDTTVNNVTDNDTSTSSDNALADATFDDVSSIADEAAESGSLSNYKMENESGLLACATVKFDTLYRQDMKDTITVTFGDSTGANCTCKDGRSRRGQIIITHDGTKRYRDSAATHSITFNNYYVDDNQVTGTKTVTNNGHNTAGHLNWTIDVDGTIVLANGGGTITWKSHRGRELLSGENSNGTINWKSAKWSITGTVSGTGAKGNSYTATITSPLVRDMSCSIPFKRHFTQGVLVLTPSGKLERTIDFGDGTCDNKATVKIKDMTYDIVLR